MGRALDAARRRSLLGAALGLALAGAGCMGPLGPRRITLSQEQMQEKLAARFPRRYPVRGLAELELQTPRLSLRPERNRLNLVMAVLANGAALRRSVHGNLDLDFALRYEPADQTVRATDIEVLALQFDGLPAPAARLLSGLGPALAQQALREVVLVQLRPGDLALAERMGLQPGPLTVTPQGLVIELVPRPPT